MGDLNDVFDVLDVPPPRIFVDVNMAINSLDGDPTNEWNSLL